MLYLGVQIFLLALFLQLSVAQTTEMASSNCVSQSDFAELFLQLSVAQTTEMASSNCVSQSDFAEISRRLNELKLSTQTDVNQLNSYVSVINPIITRQRETERKVDQLRNENRRLKSEVDNAKLKSDQMEQYLNGLMQSNSNTKNKSQELEQKVDSVAQSILEEKIKSLQVEQKVDDLTQSHAEMKTKSQEMEQQVHDIAQTMSEIKNKVSDLSQMKRDVKEVTNDMQSFRFEIFRYIVDAMSDIKSDVKVQLIDIEKLHSSDKIELIEKINIAHVHIQNNLRQLDMDWKQKYNALSELHDADLSGLQSNMSIYSEELSNATKSIHILNSSVASLVTKFNESIDYQFDNITRNAESLSRGCNSLQNDTEKKIRNLETSLQGIVENFQLLSNKTDMNHKCNEKIEEVRTIVRDQLKDVQQNVSEIRLKLGETNKEVVKLENKTENVMTSFEERFVIVREEAEVNIQDVSRNLTKITDLIIDMGTNVTKYENKADQKLTDIKQQEERMRQNMNIRINDSSDEIDNLKRRVESLQSTFHLINNGQNQTFHEQIDAIRIQITDQVEDIQVTMTDVENELVNTKREVTNLANTTDQRFNDVIRIGDSLRQSLNNRILQTIGKIESLERRTGQLQTSQRVTTGGNKRHERYLIRQSPKDVNNLIRVSSAHPHCVTKEKYKLYATEGVQERGRAGAWCAGTFSGFQYVQATFDRQHTVFGVATQGRRAPTQHQYVTAYRVYYSWDCVNFQTDGKTYPGNYDSTSLVINRFIKPITGRCFRINPTGYHGYMSMRFDFIG